MPRIDTDDMIRRILEAWGTTETGNQDHHLAELARVAVAVFQCGKTHPDRPDIRCTDLPHETGAVYCRNHALGVEWWATAERGVITVHDTLGQITFADRSGLGRYVHLPPEGATPTAGLSQCPFCGHPISHPLDWDRRRCAHCACEWDTDDIESLPGEIPDPGCPNCGFHRALAISGGLLRCCRYNCHHEWDPGPVEAVIHEAEDALPQGDVALLDEVPIYWTITETDRLPADVTTVYTTDGLRWTRNRHVGQDAWEAVDAGPDGGETFPVSEADLLRSYGSVYAHPVEVDGTPLPRVAPFGPVRSGKTDPNAAIRLAMHQAQAALVETRTLYQRVIADAIPLIERGADAAGALVSKYLGKSPGSSASLNADNYRAMRDTAHELKIVAQSLAVLLPQTDTTDTDGDGE